MPSIHDNVFKLEQLGAHQGLSPSDIICEIVRVTLSSGTAECPTIFENGKIIAVFITDSSGTITAINSTVGFATDMVVTSNAITINSNTGGAQTVSVMILGRPSI